jgi:fluoroacetyl-CoA thioesterase
MDPVESRAARPKAALVRPANRLGCRRVEGTLEPGIEASHEFVVEGRLLTDVGGTLGRSVLSTPGMIAMMEGTSARLVYPLLGDGKATVGFEVCIKHVAGAPEGVRCTVHTRLVEVIDGRKLRFEVEVVAHDGRTIGVGTHERRVVSTGG